MKYLDPTLQAEKAKANVTSLFIVKIGDYLFTDFNITINYYGDPCTPRALDLGAITTSDGSPLDGTTIKVGNADNAMSAIILNNELKNALVKIEEAYLDENLAIVGQELIFWGKVDGRPGFDEQWADITVAALYNPWTQRFPRRRLSKNCGFYFKDTDCGYSGSGSCKKTWENCTALSNTARNGGFRFMPAKGTKFTWGSQIVEIE